MSLALHSCNATDHTFVFVVCSSCLVLESSQSRRSMAGNPDDEDLRRKNQKPLDPSNFIADDEENRDSDIRSSSDGSDGISRGNLEKPLDHKKGPPNLGIHTSTSNSGKIASEVGGISSTSSARHVVGSDTFTSSSGNIGGISLTRSAGLAIGSSTLTSSSGNIGSEAQGNSLKRSAELACGSGTLTSSLGNIRDEDHCHKNQKIGGSSGGETDWKKPLDPLYFNTENGEHGELDIQSRPDGNDGTSLRNLEKPLDHKKGPPNFGIDTSTSNSGKSSSEVGGISLTELESRAIAV